MLIHPKIDKMCFTIKKSDVIGCKLKELLSYLESRNDISTSKSPYNYIIVNMNPTKLTRPNIHYDDSMSHNLQMNTQLIMDFFTELERFYVFPHILNITNLHITKDRVMDYEHSAYRSPLVDNQTQYKGRVEAYEVNNGTTPSVHVCNKSKSMNRGSWFCKNYNKAAQLKDELKVREITPLEPLSKEDIKTLGRGYSKHTGRINLDKINLMRMEFELKGEGLLMFQHYGKRLTVGDIITMIKEDTLYAELNRVYKELMERALFPQKKEPTKMSPLDEFLVSGSMSEFDRLFLALDKYQAYKEYTNSVITEDDRLLNEIYDKFS